MDVTSRPLYEFGPFCLDVAEHRLLRNGRPVPLTPKVFDLLSVLIQHAGHLVEKEQLLHEVWHEAFVEEANLSRAISVLRKALGERAADQKYIETVPTVGYRFVGEVRLRRHDDLRPQEASPPGADDDEAIASRHAVQASAAAAGLLVGGVLAYALLIGRAPARVASNSGASIHRQLTFTGKEMTPAVSPDGERIAYVSNESPQRRVVVQGLGSQQPITVFRAPEVGPLRWSPDGAELLFWGRGGGHDGLFVAPTWGGSARRMAAGPFVACWSPDSSTIAIARFLSSEIVLLDKSGATLTSIALEGVHGWIADLDWSPVNDRLLIVAADSEGRPSIWTIRSNGSDQKKVVTDESQIPAARWAAGGDAIYYFRRVYQTVSLYKVDLHSESGRRSPVPLLSGLESDGAFALSSDGRRLVYARAPYYSNLWLVEPTRSGVGDGVGDGVEDGRAGTDAIRRRPLTNGTSIIERPRVSPDGQSIVFNMGVEARANLYTLPAGGGSPSQLTFLNAFSVGGAWSTDGRSIAFVSNEGGRPRVWAVDRNGGAPYPLSSGDMSDRYDVVWSPGPRPLYEQAGNRNFSFVDPRSRQREKPLIKDGSVGWTAYPAFSPDGRTIAILWNRRSRVGVWVIDAATSEETLVYRPADSSVIVPAPVGWSPDGRSIIAVEGKRAAYRGLSTNGGETLTEARIVRVPLDSGEPSTIVALPFEEIGGVDMFPDGGRFVCAVYSSRSDVWMVDDFDAPAESQVAAKGK